MRCALFLTSVLLSFGIGLTGCTDSGPNADRPVAGDVIRRGNVEDPATLDPALAEDVHTFNILVDLYEGLVAEDARGNLVPGVAHSWSVSDDLLRYTFELRSNVLWSNGDALTAGDFARGLRRVAAPATPSSYAFLLESIENFAEVKAGEMPEDALGVEVIDERTLVIRLHEPNVYFLSLLAMPVAYPLHGDGSNPAQFEDPTRFVGNGAYVLEQRLLGRPVILRQNDRYWDAASVETESVEFVAIVDEVAEFNMYRAGELQITATIPPSHIDQAREEHTDEVRIAPSLALYYLAFDLTEPPLSVTALRQALSMAIDREQLVSLLGRGEHPAYSVVPPGVANYDGAEYQWKSATKEQRQQHARDLYQSAGYGADKPLKLKFVYDVGGIHERVALIVSAMWQETLGVSVALEKREWKYFLETRDNRDEWQVMRFSWFGDYNDASTFLNVFLSESVQNLPRYRSSDYDKLIVSAANLADLESRAAYLQQAEEILISDYPIAPLYFYVSKHMVNANISGFENNILDRHPSKYLRREK